MKRFHVHVAVEYLAASIRFHSTLFGTGPAGASAGTACCAPQPQAAKIEVTAARTMSCCG